jgi:hypothetical protein
LQPSAKNFFDCKLACLKNMMIFLLVCYFSSFFTKTFILNTPTDTDLGYKHT